MLKKEIEIKVSSPNDLKMAAQKLLNWAADAKIFCFDAPMGAGKTTFIKQLCLALNYNGNVSSPTFPIINNYSNIFHIDCYRLKSVDEAIQVGMEDCIYSNKYCFIEWAEIIKELLPENYVHITIEITGAESRIINASFITK